jgi:hypothetical protein
MAQDTRTWWADTPPLQNNTCRCRPCRRSERIQLVGEPPSGGTPRTHLISPRAKAEQIGDATAWRPGANTTTDPA